MNKKVIAGIGFIAGLLLIIAGIYQNMSVKASAISIIGGADGPTSIFLAGKVGGTLFGTIGIIVGIAVMAVVFIVCMKSKNRK